MKYYVLGLLILSLGAFAPRESGAATKCNEPEQVGCIEIDFLVVENNPAIKEISDLVTGKREGGQVAPALYRMSKKGSVRLYDGCVLQRVWVWGANAAVPTSAMAIYDHSGKRVSVTPARFDVTRAPVLEDIGTPMTAYDVNVCGGKGAIQFPWEYITRHTYMIICPIVASDARFAALHPQVGPEGGAATHLKLQFWEYASKQWQTAHKDAWEYALTVTVVADKVQVPKS